LARFGLTWAFGCRAVTDFFHNNWAGPVRRRGYFGKISSV
jgi:hypothetical protein